MTEKDLIELGFDKVNVMHSESNNGYDYYYYNLNIIKGCSLTADNKAAPNEEGKEWVVVNYDWPHIKKIRKPEIIKLIRLLHQM
jgi:hypothetical protein